MLRPLAMLLSGGGFRQVLLVATLPLLSRIYDPTAFGQLGAVMAVVSMSVVIVHGRYHLAIPVARDDGEAKALLMLATLASTALSLPVSATIMLAVGGTEIALGAAIAFAALLTLAGAVVDVATFWRSRIGRFAATARFDAARAVVTVSGQFALSVFGGLGLLFGSLLGATVASGLALRDARRDLAWPGLAAMGQAAKRYRGYPLLGVPQGWLAAASKNLLPLLLVKFASVALAGQYWLAYRLLLAPVSLIGTAYRQVALPIFASGSDTENRRNCAQHTMALLALGLVPATLLLLHGEALFTLLLGDGWGVAGAIAGWLGLSQLADACKIPTTVLAQREQRHASLLRWEMGVAAARYVAAFPPLVAGDPMLAVALFGAIGAAGWTLYVLSEALSPTATRTLKA